MGPIKPYEFGMMKMEILRNRSALVPTGGLTLEVVFLCRLSVLTSMIAAFNINPVRLAVEDCSCLSVLSKHHRAQSLCQARFVTGSVDGRGRASKIAVAWLHMTSSVYRTVAQSGHRGCVNAGLGIADHLQV